MVQDNRDDGRLQAARALDRQIQGPRRYRLDPVAESSQRTVAAESWAEAGAERIEGCVTVGALHAGFDFDAVLEVAGQRRERRLRLSRLAVAQDQEALRGRALRQDLAAQGGDRER